LPAMNRLRRARKAIARLRPLIAAAQGELAPGEISSRAREFFAEKPAPPAGVAGPPPPLINP